MSAHASRSIAPPSRKNGLPRVDRRTLDWFFWYSKRQLAARFHGVRLAGAPPALAPEQSAAIFFNHASWWDPLIGLLLHRTFFPGHTAYTAFDAAALAKYRFFARLGAFGVERDSHRGAAEFLRQSMAILQSPGSVLWLTPQGRFADVRERPVQLEPGLAHVCRRVEGVVAIPLALEYVFWEEANPEVLCLFGEPVMLPHAAAKRDDEAQLSAALAATQGRLAELALRRETTDWRTLLGGEATMKGFYGAWKRFQGWLQGTRRPASHGERPW